jgi:hypothetical protein
VKASLHLLKPTSADDLAYAEVLFEGKYTAPAVFIRLNAVSAQDKTEYCTGLLV